MFKLIENKKDSNSVVNEVNGRIELIRQLIPLGLEAVREVLEEEVNDLVGERYSRTGSDNKRWGSNAGSVYIGDQKVKIRVPRVRDVKNGKELELVNYQNLKDSKHFDEQAFRHVINGISMRNYSKAAESLPETFGVSSSNVSSKFKLAAEKRLKELFDRDLSKEDIVAIFIDGKSLKGVQVMIALGVTIEGVKIPLGFMETSTENASVCSDFINKLIERGLNIEKEILIVVDGAKGILKAINKVLGDKGIIQRCQWHKRENVVSYLPKSQQAEFRSKLQRAYQKSTYQEAKDSLLKVRKELMLINQDAVASLDEGFEETLTIHKLGVFDKVGRSFKTTNCIENLNRNVERVVGRVSRWHNSDQRRRWIASALIEIEKGFKIVEGYKQLPLLRTQMKNMNLLKEKKISSENKIAA